ncbi:MAG: response regulator transcription factor [Propionibacteriaceae bacterium]|jgi:DNA-binding response OmpR family regulator|nr:response regulator transcription factor [Propionibacteriaceae bacterium]
MTSATILFVDDEAAIRSGFREYAEFVGYRVIEAADGMEAVRLATEEDVDIIVMDVMMPKLDGFTAVKQIKKIKDIPVLMLSARGEEYDKLYGFELGIDDYVVKPFSGKEVLARIQAILARSRTSAPGGEIEHVVYVHEGLVVDMTARTVDVDGERVELSPKEADLLFYLVENRNVALSRHTLLTQVWGYDYGDERTIDTHVKTLRVKLGPYKGLIVTLRGVGYRFEG